MPRKHGSSSSAWSHPHSQDKPLANSNLDLVSRFSSQGLANGFSTSISSPQNDMREAQRLAAKFFHSQLPSPDAAQAQPSRYDQKKWALDGVRRRNGDVGGYASQSLYTEAFSATDWEDRDVGDARRCNSSRARNDVISTSSKLSYGQDEGWEEAAELESDYRMKEYAVKVKQAFREDPRLESTPSYVEFIREGDDYEMLRGKRKSISHKGYRDDEPAGSLDFDGSKLDSRHFMAYENNDSWRKYLPTAGRKGPADRDTSLIRHVDYGRSKDNGQGHSRDTFSSFLRNPSDRHTFGHSGLTGECSNLSTGYGLYNENSALMWNQYSSRHLSSDQIHDAYADMIYREHLRNAASHSPVSRYLRGDFPHTPETTSGSRFRPRGAFQGTTWSRFDNATFGRPRKGKRRSRKDDEAPYGKKSRKEREGDRLFQMHNSKASKVPLEREMKEAVASPARKKDRDVEEDEPEESDWDDDTPMADLTVGRKENGSMWEKADLNHSKQPENQSWNPLPEESHRPLSDEEQEFVSFRRIQAAACKSSRDFLREISEDDEDDNDSSYGDDEEDEDWCSVASDLECGGSKETPSFSAAVEGKKPDGKSETNKKPEPSDERLRDIVVNLSKAGEEHGKTEKLDGTHDGTLKGSAISKMDSVDSLIEKSKGREEKAYDHYSSIFEQDKELQKLYKAELNCGSFECLVCAGCGAGGKKRYSDIVSLVQHAKKIMKTSRRQEHRGFARAVSHMLGWDTTIPMPSVVPRGCIPPPGPPSPPLLALATVTDCKEVGTIGNCKGTEFELLSGEHIQISQHMESVVEKGEVDDNNQSAWVSGSKTAPSTDTTLQVLVDESSTVEEAQALDLCVSNVGIPANENVVQFTSFVAVASAKEFGIPEVVQVTGYETVAASNQVEFGISATEEVVQCTSYKKVALSTVDGEAGIPANEVVQLTSCEAVTLAKGASELANEEEVVQVRSSETIVSSNLHGIPAQEAVQVITNEVEPVGGVRLPGNEEPVQVKNEPSVGELGILVNEVESESVGKLGTEELDPAVETYERVAATRNSDCGDGSSIKKIEVVLVINETNALKLPANAADEAIQLSAPPISSEQTIDTVDQVPQKASVNMMDTAWLHETEKHCDRPGVIAEV